MHFALSLGRVGLDFRALLAPLFETAAVRLYQSRMSAATVAFATALRSAGMVSHAAFADPAAVSALPSSTATPTVPPAHASEIPAGRAASLRLMAHPPLAQLTNAVLAAANELRECAPVAVAPALVAATEEVLRATAGTLARFHQV